MGGTGYLTSFYLTVMLKKSLLFLVAILVNVSLIGQDSEPRGWDEIINDAFTPIADVSLAIVLHNFPGSAALFGQPVPSIIILLVIGALFFTIYFGFINIRRFGTSINVVRGKYDELEGHGLQEGANVNIESGDIVDTIRDESQDGEVSHFQALATAVSGTVGNGNIAGVALAIAIGGPGATFWMIICGLLGMSTKFVECTLGVKYRTIGPDGTVYGGPMYYMSRGLEEKGFATLGKILAGIFAFICIGASFGGGNMAQSNQAAQELAAFFNFTGGSARTIIGLVMCVFIGIIIIGGIKRIASVTEKVVPFMAVLYILACLYILGVNFSYIDDAFGQIFSQAFSPKAGLGGLFGVLIVGFQRAAFSNEAGAGSASIAHSAVKTKYAASEGLVALLEPFIDTVVICTMTALVIIIFNQGGEQFAYGGDGNGGVLIDGETLFGAGITSKAFGAYIPFAGGFLTLCVVLFAVSTMISWSYYGLQSWKYFFGKGKTADLIYKLLFLGFVIVGAAGDMRSVWGFSDAMILGLVFPNMIALFFLYPKVKEELTKYLSAIKNSNA